MKKATNKAAVRLSVPPPQPVWTPALQAHVHALLAAWGLKADVPF